MVIHYLRDMNEVTQLLSRLQGGDRQAAEQLLPLVYDELRKLAAQRLSQERPGQTLQATALVHEAYLRLVGDQRFENRQHFLVQQPRLCGESWSSRHDISKA